MNALTFSSFGDAEVLEYIEVPKPKIAKGEVLIQMKAIGLNFADIYRRKGHYHLKGEPPYIAGYEGAGQVVESKSSQLNVGDKVAFADVPFANAEYVKAHEDHVIILEDHVPYQLAASLLLQGMTAHYLCHDSHLIQPKEVVVIHAAAGGVGQLLLQMCKMRGATVIGLSRSAKKLEKIKELGADHALLLTDKWAQDVLHITEGEGVDVVYDSIGATLNDSIAVTKEKGTIVFYGMSGGDPAQVDPRVLMDGSKKLVGGDLWSYLKTSQDRAFRAHRLFQWIFDAKLVVAPPEVFELEEGEQAHEFLESGKSEGKVLLVP